MAFDAMTPAPASAAVFHVARCAPGSTEGSAPARKFVATQERPSEAVKVICTVRSASRFVSPPTS